MESSLIEVHIYTHTDDESDSMAILYENSLFFYNKNMYMYFYIVLM